ncbi:MAG TPA: anti-sigma factor [Solirubrobacteraceae bacterium]|nr:anti-sigma factor [Solirubrobacteraceae bacterium]
MSPRGSDWSCPRADDAAAHVLGALEHDELERFREHLAGCAQCRSEVAELQPIVDELPAGVPPVRAPAQMRERILATVRSEAELLHAAGIGADRPPRRAGFTRVPRLALTGAGLALAAIAAVLIAVTIGSSSHSVVTRGTAPAGATAALHQRDGHAELVLRRMPRPALGRIYEVWLKRGSGEPQPTDALFSVTRAGSAAVHVPNLDGVREVLVTSEPAGGSARPTSAPLIRVALGTA